MVYLINDILQKSKSTEKKLLTHCFVGVLPGIIGLMSAKISDKNLLKSTVKVAIA